MVNSASCLSDGSDHTTFVSFPPILCKVQWHSFVHVTFNRARVARAGSVVRRLRKRPSLRRTGSGSVLGDVQSVLGSAL